jgi:hypothetical protein
MRTTFTVLLLIIAAVLLSWLYISHHRSQRLGQQYAYLDSPRLSDHPSQRVLVVEARGDPNRSAGPAISSLYKVFFSMHGKGLWLKMPAPRARWPQGADQARADQTGVFALPLPVGEASLPAKLPATPLPVRLETWEYGPVVEVLHHGGYRDEAPTLARLQAFAVTQGYVLVGPHEEEYLKGPGMFGPGDPRTYLTILRYRVQKDPLK